MSRRLAIVFRLAFVLSLAFTASATTYYVDLNGSDDANGLSWETAFATIQHGIDEASNDDVVEVNEGTYYEAIDFGGKAITVRSVAPNEWDIVEVTIIDGNGATNTVALSYGQNPTLTGLTVIGGTRGIYSAGSSSAAASNCIIRNNTDKGIMVYGSATTVTNCIIKGNSNEGISVGGASLIVKNSLIYNNDTGVTVNAYCSPTIQNCTIVNNNSYGVIKTSQYASATIKNCILWNNSDDLNDCTATYSCISDGDSGTGNINNDPCFIDSDEFYHLQLDSPCIDAGQDGNYEGQTDIDGDARVAAAYIDMGADEFPLRVHNVTTDIWYVTINEAIEDAAEEDTIMVYPGTYYEAIDVFDKDITITSVDPCNWEVVENTIIDGNGATNTVAFRFYSDSGLNGFTITGGDCGVYGFNLSSIIISNCVITDNSGAGLEFYQCNMTIKNCIVKNNTNEGISLEAVYASIKNNLVYNNGQGIISIGGIEVDIHNCTIVNNNGYGVKKANTGDMDVRNCIIWNNSDDLYNCTATYSCISDGDSGTSNISSYPYFANYDSNDFHLTLNSPCINKGDQNGTYTGQSDIDGDIRVADEEFVDKCVDIGADEFAQHLINLVPNPGFELGGGGLNSDEEEDSSVPLYWHVMSNASSQSIDDTEMHSGDCSWTFSTTSYKYPYIYSKDVISIPSRVFKVSGWLKGDTGNERNYCGWQEYDESGNTVGSKLFFLSEPEAPQEWEHFYSYRMLRYKNSRTMKLLFSAPNESLGQVWCDDFSINELKEFLRPYGCGNETNEVETVEFGNDEVNTNWVVEINDTSVISGPDTDSNDENITYRKLKAGKSINIEFPAFNIDSNGFPLTPMLLEIMYRDDVNDNDAGNAYDRIFIYSHLDFSDIDPNYLSTPPEQYGIGNIGGYNDGKWKYFQYAFAKTDFQLLRAIDGKLKIKIESDTDYSGSTYELPIDYISLRKISEEECLVLEKKLRDFAGFKLVELPADYSSGSNYDDPNLVVFVRDIMKPIYTHTKPAPNEPNSISTFSCWGETEPVSFAVYSQGGLENISIEVSNLVHTDGNAIDGNNIEIYQVTFDQKRLKRGSPWPYALQADRIKAFDEVSVDVNSTKMFWLKIKVPSKNQGFNSGKFSGNIYIKQNSLTAATIPLELEVYGLELGLPDQFNPILFGDPFDSGTRIISTSLGNVLDTYAETGLDPHFRSSDYGIDVGDFNEYGTLDFNSVLFEQAMSKMTQSGYAKDKITISTGQQIKDIYYFIYGKSLYIPEAYELYNELNEPNFRSAFGDLISEYDRIGDIYDVNFVYFVADEPGANVGRRIYCDRICDIIMDNNSLTTITYTLNCDEELDPGDYNTPGGANVPSLEKMVDYKMWLLSHTDEGYAKHQDPNYYGEFGYYTTFHSHFSNPIYNRFLHGLYAFTTDAKVIGPYTMGGYQCDPYNDFDQSYTVTYPYPLSTDYIFAYPTWTGEIIGKIGGLEAIREGIKDAKYIATLKKLIDENLSNPCASDANNYLGNLKSCIDPNYKTAYADQSTEYGYYHAILENVSETNDSNDFEAFTRIRKDIAEYIVLLCSLASEPNPVDEAEDVNTSTLLSWTPGSCALSYDVYLGADYNDVNDANTMSSEYMGNYDANSFDPNTLDYSTTYYWRLDGISDVGTAKGNIWSFTTIED